MNTPVVIDLLVVEILCAEVTRLRADLASQERRRAGEMDTAERNESIALLTEAAPFVKSERRRTRMLAHVEWLRRGIAP